MFQTGRGRYTRQGSRMRKMLAACLFVFLWGFLCFTGVFADELPKPVEDAKAGIVRIRSECVTNTRTLETREQTGFLVGEKGQEPSVVTTCEQLTFSDKDMKRLSKRFSLGENEQISTRIFMIFQRDVKIELSLVGKSDMLNLAVLRPGQTLTDKYILEFAESAPVKDQIIYFLFFQPGTDQTTNYSKNTVQASRTQVTNLAARAEGPAEGSEQVKKEDRTQYFYHGVRGGSSILGGPFLDEKGKIVGMIVGAEAAPAGEDGQTADSRIALTSAEIMKFLELHNIKYSREKSVAAAVSRNNTLQIIIGILIILLTIMTVVRAVRMRSAADGGSLSSGGGTEGSGGRKRAVHLPAAGLKRSATGESVQITTDRFVIGSVPVGNDYVISGNPKISRRHACIIYEKGKFHIEDMHSTNGTSVNDIRLESGVKQRLTNGARIRLADEDFVFWGK